MGGPTCLYRTVLRMSQPASHQTHRELECLNKKAMLHLHPRVREPKLPLCKFFTLPGKALANQKLRKISKQMDTLRKKST